MPIMDIENMEIPCHFHPFYQRPGQLSENKVKLASNSHPALPLPTQHNLKCSPSSCYLIVPHIPGRSQHSKHQVRLAPHPMCACPTQLCLIFASLYPSPYHWWKPSITSGAKKAPWNPDKQPHPPVHACVHPA